MFYYLTNYKHNINLGTVDIIILLNEENVEMHHDRYNNITINNYLVCSFLEREFSSYGLQVIDLMEDDPIGRPDPMSRIFPKVTKCTMRK